MNAIELSKNIIAYAAMNGYQVTNLKLQKTLYYVQGYYLARFGKPLFADEIVNWLMVQLCQRHILSFALMVRHRLKRRTFQTILRAWAMESLAISARW